MIHFIVPEAEADLPLDYFDRGGIQGRASVITFEEVLERESLPLGVYVFGGVNLLRPATAHLLTSVHEQLARATGVVPLNHPVRSLRRYELIRALRDRDLIPYTAYGAWEDYSSVRLPAFVRPRDIDTVIPELRHSIREIERDIGNAISWGRPAEELVVIEFADTSVDGLFTKYAAHRVGDRILARSIDRGTHWVQRRQHSDITMALIDEAAEYEESNPWEDQIREIFEIARIEFGRMDFSVVDGRVICWEINTLPSMHRPHGVAELPEDLRAARLPGRERFAERLRDAFEVLLDQADAIPGVDAPDGGSVAIRHDPGDLAAARHEVATRGLGMDATGPLPFPRMRRMLGPLKPILRPIATRTIYPLLARLSRG